MKSGKLTSNLQLVDRLGTGIVGILGHLQEMWKIGHVLLRCGSHYLPNPALLDRLPHQIVFWKLGFLPRESATPASRHRKNATVWLEPNVRYPAAGRFLWAKLDISKKIRIFENAIRVSPFRGTRFQKPHNPFKGTPKFNPMQSQYPINIPTIIPPQNPPNPKPYIPFTGSGFQEPRGPRPLLPSLL